MSLGGPYNTPAAGESGMSFVGSQLSQAAAPGFNLSHWRVDRAGDAVKPHGHKRAHVMWAMAGAYETAADGDSPAGRDILVYNPPGVFHADRFLTPGGCFFAVDIEDGDVGGLAGAPLPSAPCQIASEAPRAALRRLAGECARWSADSGLVAEALCLELLASVAGRESRERRAPGWLERACEMLHEEAPGSISVIAKEVGVHPTHFARSFRMWFDCTPGEFARSRRLARAASLLKASRQEISRIAFETGFADQSHLTRVFKRAFGLAPAAYRRAFAATAR
jgi:AraC family transcriptional regulator